MSSAASGERLFIECTACARCVVVTPALVQRACLELSSASTAAVRQALAARLAKFVCTGCGAHSALLRAHAPGGRFCEDCDRPIAQERVRASPSCTRCVTCEATGGADAIALDPPAHFWLLEDDPDERTAEQPRRVDARCTFCGRRILPGEVLTLAARAS